MASYRRWALAAAALSFLLELAAPRVAHACEPMVPLGMLLGGPLLLVRSVIGMGVVVLLKSLFFAQFQTGLRWPSALLFMVAANLVSTLVGFVALGGVVAPFLLPLILPVYWALSLKPAQRMIDTVDLPAITKLGARKLAALLTLVMFLSMVAFVLAQSVGEQGRLSLYWLTKLAYVYLALVFSILLTTFWEDWTVERLAAHKARKRSYLMPILKSNLLTLGLIMLYATVRVLPQRLASPHFLLPW